MSKRTVTTCDGCGVEHDGLHVPDAWSVISDPRGRSGERRPPLDCCSDACRARLILPGEWWCTGAQGRVPSGRAVYHRHPDGARWCFADDGNVFPPTKGRP